MRSVPVRPFRRPTVLGAPRKYAVKRTNQAGAPAAMHGQVTHQHASAGVPAAQWKERNTTWLRRRD